MELQIVANIEDNHPSTDSKGGNITCHHRKRIPPPRGAGMAITFWDDCSDTEDQAHAHLLRDQLTRHIKNLTTTVEGNGRQTQE